MQKMIVSLITLLFLLISLAVMGQEKKQNDSGQTAPQVFEGRLQVRVTGIENVQTWKVLPNNPYSPVYEAKEGMDLLVVKFEVKKVQNGEADWDQEFKDFELEDQNGGKYNSVIVKTNKREIGFGVSKGVSLKIFRIAGLTFDITKIPVAKAK